MRLKSPHLAYLLPFVIIFFSSFNASLAQPLPDSLTLLDNAYPLEDRVSRMVEFMYYHRITNSYEPVLNAMDSLYHVASVHQDTTTMAYAVVFLSEAAFYKMGDSVSNLYSRIGAKLMKGVPDDLKTTLLSNLVYNYLYIMHEIDTAKILADQMLYLANILNSAKAKSKAYSSLAHISQLKGAYNQALKYINLQISVLIKLENSSIKLQNLGGAYYKRGKILRVHRNLKGAVINFKKAIELFKEANDFNSLIHAMSELFEMEINYGIKNLSGYADSLLIYSKEKVYCAGLFQAYVLKGVSEYNNKNWKEALLYLRKSHDYDTCKFIYSTSYMKVRDAYQIATEAVFDYISPQQYSSIFLDTTGNLQNQIILTDLYATMHELVGSLDSALFYSRKSNYLNKELLNKEVITQSQQLEALYQNQQKEAQIAELEADKQVQAAVAAREAQQKQYLAYGLGGTLLAILLLASAGYKLQARSKLIKQQKEQLETQNTVLENANHCKDQFFSILAHDLQAPLVHVQRLFTLHKQQLAKQSTSIGIELNEMEEDFHIVNHLLKNLLHWSLDQRNGTMLRPKQVLLQELLEEVVSVAAPLALKKNLALEEQYHTSEPVIIMADPDMLAFIVRNLVMNAIQHTLQGGTIAIKLEKTATTLAIIVRDNGSGMPAELLEKLANGEVLPGSRRGTTGERGTGLGLLQSMQFATQMNIDLRFSSAKREGTTVVIQIPVENIVAV